jgi:osmoprotectant transport system permease protein
VILLVFLVWMAAGVVAPAHADPDRADASTNEGVRIGSKKFTESVLLGEILVQLARSAGSTAEHRAQLGGTRILFNALEAGDIDAYPEYTGTITQEILVGRSLRTHTEIRTALAEHGICMSRPLGFNNTYALGMLKPTAERLGVRCISDLRNHPDLALGFTNEFMDRKDGWPSLRQFYDLPQTDVRGLDHDLAYRGLAAGTVAVTDLYMTDAEITYYDLFVLDDDRHHFPEYHAVLLYREDVRRRRPEAVATMLSLEGAISQAAMVKMNARAKIDKVDERQVAAEFLNRGLGVESDFVEETWLDRLVRHTGEHLLLVVVSLGMAILISLPLGIAAARYDSLGHAILSVVGIIQTIPSLALLVFMIPLLGIGGRPAIAALFLYSLLPIVRNTHAGLKGISPDIRESAEALGLPRGALLIHVDLPLAAPSILAGIKTSAVINVGTATLGALIGAGGYGQPILTGIRLDDTALILQGAVPAALLAILAQLGFEGLEHLVVSKGLRLKRESIEAT